jgi:effector-binding domain-containing protein
MRYEIQVETVQPELVAAVRAKAPVGGVAQVWKPALDQVWAFLRTNGQVRRGHNLFLYHHAARRNEPMDIDFGVQVAHPFEPAGNVRCIATPAGEVASTVHIGPYDRLGDAHRAIHAWCSANNRTIGPASWEIYGDWTDDPARLETTIKYLLA